MPDSPSLQLEFEATARKLQAARRVQPARPFAILFAVSLTFVLLCLEFVYINYQVSRPSRFFRQSISDALLDPVSLLLLSLIALYVIILILAAIKGPSLKNNVEELENRLTMLWIERFGDEPRGMVVIPGLGLWGRPVNLAETERSSVPESVIFRGFLTLLGYILGAYIAGLILNILFLNNPKPRLGLIREPNGFIEFRELVTGRWFLQVLLVVLGLLPIVVLGFFLAIGIGSMLK